MTFTDAILVRLATPAARGQVLTADALGRVAAAAYDTDALLFQGPYTAVYDRFELCVPAQPSAVHGTWTTPPAGDSSPARFEITGLTDLRPLRVDALWRGAVVARAIPATGRVTGVRVGLPNLVGIDAAVAAANGGALPPEPALETARRAELRARLAAGYSDSGYANLPAGSADAGFADAALAGLLRSRGTVTVGELLRGDVATAQAATVQVTYEPVPAQAAPTPLPVCCAVLVRDAGFGLADTLAEAAAVRDWAVEQGLAADRDDRWPPRRTVVVALVVPDATFDDAGWPGANPADPAEARRQARIAAAAGWLAREGIALVPASVA